MKPSSRPHPGILERLATTEVVFLSLALLTSAVVLTAWLVPAVRTILPAGWSLMKANTAFAVLLCCVSLKLARAKTRVPRVLLSRACALMAFAFAAASLLEHISGMNLGVDTLLAADPGAQMPGRMSVQSALSLALLSGSLLIALTRQGILGHLLDTLLAALVTLIFVLIAGYVFGAAAMLGQSWATRTSVQTLTCLTLLTFVQVARRAPHGYFSVLVGVGIGSHIARVALPFSLILIYVLIFLGAESLAAGYLALPTAAALTAASMAALTSFLTMMAARKINDLEGALRDLSLTDELTGLHNRRGFLVLGEQALRDARRAAVPSAVLFIDADGLKSVNDDLGHDVGSELLRDIASLMCTTFRNSDVIGRLGGDEFGVVMYGGQSESAAIVRRLHEATAKVNRSRTKPYEIRFSVGIVTSEPQSDEAFAELLQRADAVMYENKRQKRTAGSPTESTAAADLQPHNRNDGRQNR